MVRKQHNPEGGARVPYSVPDGYFDGLKVRLAEIPLSGERKAVSSRTPVYRAVAFTFAAGLAVLLVLGVSFGRREKVSDVDLFYEQAVLAGLVPLSSHVDFYEEAGSFQEEEDDASQFDDAENYLLESLSTYQLLEYSINPE